MGFFVFPGDFSKTKGRRVSLPTPQKRNPFTPTFFFRMRVAFQGRNPPSPLLY